MIDATGSCRTRAHMPSGSRDLGARCDRFVGPESHVNLIYQEKKFFSQ
jgi:hypothetical protein